MDSRPSDAIALALRTDCPIFVDSEVIKSVAKFCTGDEAEIDESPSSEEDWPDSLGMPATSQCKLLSI